MQSCDADAMRHAEAEQEGMGMGMSMHVSDSSSSSASSNRTRDESAYRQVERLFRAPPAPPQRRKDARIRARAHSGSADGAEVDGQGQERWRSHTLDLVDLERNSPAQRARIVERAVDHEAAARVAAEAAASLPASSCPPVASGAEPRSWLSPHARLFSFTDLPGFLVLRGALTPAAQAWWAWRSLECYSRAEHTNLTNLQRIKQQQQHQQAQANASDAASPSSAAPPEPLPNLWRDACTSGDLSPLATLRWSSLGFHYDWSEREYTAESRSAFPEELANLSAQLAAAAGFPSLRAEAAIVNFYPPGGVMGAHVDDAELTKLAPIVSVSLGCRAAFLLGGRTRATSPTGFILASGDVCIMGGESRVCYHGVPRIWPRTFWNDQSDEASPSASASSTASASEEGEEDGWSAACCMAALLPSTIADGVTDRNDAPAFLSVPPVPSHPTRLELLRTLQYLRHNRLNLNMRQVEDDAFTYAGGFSTHACRAMPIEQQREMAMQSQASKSQSPPP